MERPGSADPNGEKVAERTWDCPCHAWHLGSLRRSIVSGESKCRPSPSVPYANGAWRARDLPETALHAPSPRLTPRPSTASLTCVTVWEREVVEGVVNPPRIDGMQALRLSYLRSSIIPSRVRCARCVPAASTGGHRPAAKLQVSRPTRQLGYDPSQGGSAGSNPVGATTVIDHDELRRRLDQLVTAGAPGAAGWVQDGRDSLRSASGVADLSTGRPMRADLRFRAGSATKSLVATVVLQPVAEGRLSLRDTVEGWLPGILPYGDRLAIGRLLTTPAACPTIPRRSTRPCTGRRRPGCAPGPRGTWSAWWPTSRRGRLRAPSGRTPTPDTSCSG